ncbi:MAG: hypothetical protein KGD72_11755 [Candidatus Lokiarchaeota archaeon]|nr:hypothetical protein [Candidatus Lokiarchaeota archaeon]
MAIQITKMIMHGILSAVLYIALPLILFEVISMMGLMTFTQEFKTTIIIIGIIGVVFSMLSHAFPKDTSANRLIAFGSIIYSGIYLFYLFGGFTPGVQLGNYSINVPPLQVLLGLQVIAWLLLGSSGLRALKYLIEAVELRKNKEYRVKKKFKLSKFFKVLGTILGLIIFGYLGSIVYSGMNLGFSFHPLSGFVRDPGVLPDPDFSDDTISTNITFDLNNQGLYAIYNAYVGVELRIQDSMNLSLLPIGLKIGGGGKTFETFHSFTNNINNSVTLVIGSTYMMELATTDATLELILSFNTVYASILINLNITVGDIPWSFTP